MSSFIGAYAEESVETGSPAFAVTSVEDAHPGDEVRIEIVTKNNPGFAAFRYRVNYDREHFELVASNERDFSGIFCTPLGIDPFMVAWFDVSTGGDNTTNGVTAELVFKVKDGTPDAVYPIELSYYQQGDVCNFNGDIVDFELINGSITVGHGEETVTLPPPNDPSAADEGGRSPDFTLPVETRKPPQIPDTPGQIDLTLSELEGQVGATASDAVTEGSTSSKKGKKNSSSASDADPDAAENGDTSAQSDPQNGADDTSAAADRPATFIEGKSGAGIIAAVVGVIVIIAVGAVLIVRRNKD